MIILNSIVIVLSSFNYLTAVFLLLFVFGLIFKLVRS